MTKPVAKKGVLYRYMKAKYLFLMLLPVLVYYVIFHYVPMYGVVIAFQDFLPRLGVTRSEWVGLDNFKRVFDSIYFWPAFRNTLIISSLKLLFGFPAPILLAILLNEVRNKNFKRTVQTITYLPHFISWVVLAGIVIEILSPSRGFVNYIIEFFGGEPIHFVAERTWFRIVLVVSSIWRSIGWQSIVFLAAISGIDQEMYEAAEIDGATRLHMMRFITIPSIYPTIIIMFIFAVGGIIQDDFDQIFNLLNPRVYSVGDVIGTLTYRVGLSQMEYSLSTAIGLFRNVIALVLVYVTNLLSRKMSETSLW